MITTVSKLSLNCILLIQSSLSFQYFKIKNVGQTCSDHWFHLNQAKKAKQAEIERKRAEVRKRMEEASKAKKAKKGFMTPERKKKLRVRK